MWNSPHLFGTKRICTLPYPPPPTHTRTQHLVGPEFHLSQYQATEGETEVVRLSAPILTRHQIPAFTGSIQVDITAEDLPSGDPLQNAMIGKCHPFMCTHYYNLCPVDVIPFCIVICPLYLCNRRSYKTESSKFCSCCLHVTFITVSPLHKYPFCINTLKCRCM